MTRKVTTLAIAGIVALGMLSMGVGSAVAVPDAPAQTAGNQTAENQTANVTIQNQTSNGSAVMANSTTLPQSGFLVVYNATLSAPLGNSSTLQSGSQQNVSVMLNQSLTQNTTVLVAAFQDANNNSQFDLGTDEVFMSNGQPVIQSAMVNVTGMNATMPANATTPTPTPANATTPTPTPANMTTPTPANETTPANMTAPANETMPANETTPEDEPNDGEDEDEPNDDEPNDDEPLIN